MDLQKNISLLSLNTFALEAKAKLFVEVNKVDDLLKVIESGATKEEEVLVMGGGSNMLFVEDYDGLVLKNNLKGIEFFEEDGRHFARAAAGEVWHEFVLFTIEAGFGGLENLSLIPGSVGASPIQNIGAYGVELKDRFVECEAINLEDGSFRKFNNEECRFGYRDSIFKQELKGKYFITSVTVEVFKDPEFNIEYGQIKAELEAQGVKELNPKAISDAVVAIRSSKLPNPKEIGNAGSFFKNPIISKELLKEIQIKYPDIVFYDMGDNTVKVPAGWLLDQSGWKGKTIENRYGVHKNQALVLVHYKNATGQEIFDLSEQIIASIKNKYGIELEREVNII